MDLLSTAAMILVCSYLLGDGRTMLEGSPLLLPLIDEVEKLKARLTESRKEAIPSLPPDEEKEIRHQLRTFDSRHDLLNWCIVQMLRLVQRWTTDDNFRTQIEEAHTHLFPYNLSINRMKWIDEAGEALRLGEQITQPQAKKLLQSISFSCQGQTYTLLQLAEELAQIGANMEELLLQLNVPQGKDSLPPSELVARRHFYKVIKTIINLAEIAYPKQPDQYEPFLTFLNNQIEEYKKEETTND